MRALFQQIVTAINGEFAYRSDETVYGKAEHWSDLKRDGDKLVGDCEDYCLTIANRAIAAGIPPGELALHLVATKRRRPDHIILEYDGWFADCNTRGLLRDPPYRRISYRRLDQAEWQRA